MSLIFVMLTMLLIGPITVGTVFPPIVSSPTAPHTNDEHRSIALHIILIATIVVWRSGVSKVGRFVRGEALPHFSATGIAYDLNAIFTLQLARIKAAEVDTVRGFDKTKAHACSDAGMISAHLLILETNGMSEQGLT